MNPPGTIVWAPGANRGATRLPRVAALERIDLFSHNRDHEPEPRMFRMERTLEYAAAGGLFMTDNSHRDRARDACGNRLRPAPGRAGSTGRFAIVRTVRRSR